MFAVVTRDLTARSIPEDDYAADSLTEALDVARARWDSLARPDKKDMTVTVYSLPAGDFARVQEGDGDYENYAFEVKVYALGYIEEADE